MNPAIFYFSIGACAGATFICLIVLVAAICLARDERHNQSDEDEAYRSELS